MQKKVNFKKSLKFSIEYSHKLLICAQMYGFPKYGHILSCHAQPDVRIISFAIMVSHCVLVAWLFNLCIVTYTAGFVGKCYV